LEQRARPPLAREHHCHLADDVTGASIDVRISVAKGRAPLFFGVVVAIEVSELVPGIVVPETSIELNDRVVRLIVAVSANAAAPRALGSAVSGQSLFALSGGFG